MRQAEVFFKEQLAGTIRETETGYEFEYQSDYFKDATTPAVSKTLLKDKTKYESKVLFPFFDGLIPEGWLLDIAIENWKLNYRDRMGLLLACCKDSIGAVSIKETKDSKTHKI
jgi:serine/threonine-protein kinase HipA